MFGIGAQEMLIIGLLALVIFGPGKLPGMARDLGGFVGKARASVEEFKSELASGEGAFEDRDDDPHGGPEEGGETQHQGPEEAWQHGEEAPETWEPGEIREDGRLPGEDGGSEEDQPPAHESTTGTSGGADAAVRRPPKGRTSVEAFVEEERGGA